MSEQTINFAPYFNQLRNEERKSSLAELQVSQKAQEIAGLVLGKIQDNNPKLGKLLENTADGSNLSFDFLPVAGGKAIIRKVWEHPCTIVDESGRTTLSFVDGLFVNIALPVAHSPIKDFIKGFPLTTTSGENLGRIVAEADTIQMRVFVPNDRRLRVCDEPKYYLGKAKDSKPLTDSTLSVMKPNFFAGIFTRSLKAALEDESKSHERYQAHKIKETQSLNEAERMLRGQK